MAQPTSNKTTCPVLTATVLKRLEGRIGELGLCLWVTGPNSAELECRSCPSAFCRTVSGSRQGPCASAAVRVAGQAIQENRGVTSSSGMGCRVMAVPVHQRRRLVGAAVACYPTVEMLDEELLARTCDRLQLDREAATTLAQRSCRHGAAQGGDFLNILEWLLQDAQSLAVSDRELGTLSANLANTYEELSLLYTISGSVRVTEGPEEFLQKACEEMQEVMGLEATAAVVRERGEDGQDLVVVCGMPEAERESIRRLITEDIWQRLSENHRPIVDNGPLAAGELAAGRQIHNLVATPLAGDGGAVVGVFVGLNKLAGDFDSNDMKLINSVGSQTAMFLENNRLYADMQDLLMGVLHALTASIDAKDPYTCGHSMRVAALSQRLAASCGYPAEKVERFYLAGLLHDIGKIGVPESILCKKAKLTTEEYDVIKRHPTIGVRILTGIRQLDDVVVGILTHHERLDGAGYPQGLSAQDVPLEGRIVGLADAFDAITSDRVYRSAMSIEDVPEVFRKGAGTQFDTDLVDRLLAMDLHAFVAEMQNADGMRRSVLDTGVDER